MRRAVVAARAAACAGRPCPCASSPCSGATPPSSSAGLELRLDERDRRADALAHGPGDLRLRGDREVAADVLEERAVGPREVVRIGGQPRHRLLALAEHRAPVLEAGRPVDVRVDQVLDRAVDRSRVLIHARLQLREVLFHSDSSLLVRFSDGRCHRGAQPVLPEPSLPGSRPVLQTRHDRCQFETTDAIGRWRRRSALRIPLATRLDPLDARALDRGAGAPERAGRVRLALVHAR